MKKYELTTNTIVHIGRTLYQIKALKTFANVIAGDLGGYVETEDNLLQYGDAWVYGDAKVYGNAKVCGDALVYDNAEVYGNAKVYGDAEVCGDAWVCGNAKVCDNAWVYGNALVCGDAWVCGNAKVCGNANVCGNYDYTLIKGFGTEYRNTTFFRCEDGNVRVVCGCFYGTIDEFRERVKTTRTGKIAEEYLMVADLMEFHFREENTNDM